jgi:hypothetical protein
MKFITLSKETRNQGLKQLKEFYKKLFEVEKPNLTSPVEMIKWFESSFPGFTLAIENYSFNYKLYMKLEDIRICIGSIVWKEMIRDGIRFGYISYQDPVDTENDGYGYTPHPAYGIYSNRHWSMFWDLILKDDIRGNFSKCEIAYYEFTKSIGYMYPLRIHTIPEFKTATEFSQAIAESLKFAGREDLLSRKDILNPAVYTDPNMDQTDIYNSIKYLSETVATVLERADDAEIII